MATKKFDRLPVIEQAELDLALCDEPAHFFVALESEALPDNSKGVAPPDKNCGRMDD